MSTSPAASASRPSVIQLSIKEKAALYAAYIPLFADGGIFIPSTRDYRLGDDVYVLLSLPDDPQRYPVAGKVAWVTPANATQMGPARIVSIAENSSSTIRIFLRSRLMWLSMVRSST